MSEIGDQQGQGPGVKEPLQLFYFCVCSGQYGCKSELLEACESEGYIKVLFRSVAGICQGQEEAIGEDLGHFTSSNGVAQDLGGMDWTHYYQNSV